MSRDRSPLREPTGPWEFLLGLLAIVSVLIFLLPYFESIAHFETPAFITGSIVPVDIGICVVFGADYLVRMGRSRKPPISFARENFFQPFAAIPLSTPIVSDIQLVLLLIIASRFVRAFNVVFGQRAFQSIVHRYSGLVAREITDAVMIRSMATAREVATRGRFAHWVADALDRRRGELHAIVQSSLSRIPAWDQFRKIPGTEEIMKRGESLVVDAMIETMRSDRLNILVANVIDDSLEEFEKALEAKYPGLAVDALGPDAEGRDLRAVPKPPAA